MRMLTALGIDPLEQPMQKPLRQGPPRCPPVLCQATPVRQVSIERQALVETSPLVGYRGSALAVQTQEQRSLTHL